MLDGEAKSPNDGRAQRALDALFWRDEILQVMYWMSGEDLSETVRAQDLEIFLAADGDTIQLHLELAVNEGYVQKVSAAPLGSQQASYALTAEGRREGGRRFRDEFAEMQKSGHGECSADCVCHTTGDHASCPTHGHEH